MDLNGLIWIRSLAVVRDWLGCGIEIELSQSDLHQCDSPSNEPV